MRKLISVVLAVSIFMTALVGCGDSDKLSFEDQNDLIAGVDHDESDDNSLTILICGSAGYDVETAASAFENKCGTKVKIVKYDDNEWDKFATKIMAQDSDFDLFLPIVWQLGDIIRSGIYEDLSGYEDIKTRIEGNSLTKMLAAMGDEIIGVPCNAQLSYSGDIEPAYSLFKYCYKNIDLYTGEYSDPDGEELLGLLKHHFLDPSDSRENQFYDFEFYEANTSYLFMNKNSGRKDMAVDFLCLLFDILNKDVESTAYMTYPEPAEGAEYIPSWRYYSYDYVEAIGNAFSSAVETDGSDEALRKLAEDAAKAVRMRLNG